MLSSARPDENLKKRWKREGCATREILVPQRSINSLLNEFNIERIDFMSLDLEGGEADVLRGLDFHRHRPKLFCIENAVPDSESFRLLVQEGYRLIRSRHCNYFFEPESKENYGRLQKF